jgi:parallel beta-helix repeat protein
MGGRHIQVRAMKKYKLIVQVMIVFCLMFVNFIPIIGIQTVGESGAPVGNVTNVTWYIFSNDDVTYSNQEYWTKAIQINSTGKMTWNNVTAYIDGDITVTPDAFFNLTDCLLNVSGNISIAGVVNFDNVILMMNSTYDSEFGINVNSTGAFNVLNNSNITAFDKTTPVDVFSQNPGNESWGSHYNFTVHGNLTINNSFISYTYGNPNYFGGIHLYETAFAQITNSTIFETEVAGIHAEGNTSHIIKNNHIYNVTTVGIILINDADALIDGNTIETFTSNFGYGIACFDHSDPIIIRNTIKNNLYDGIYLIDYSNATIQNNTIRDNERVGIHMRGRVLSVTTVATTTHCYPRIIGNDIINNFEYGIFDLSCPAEIQNNTISDTGNGSGIWLRNNQTFGAWVVGFTCFGNISNNTIQNNDHYGINITSDWFNPPYVATMNIEDNVIRNNNWSGINILGGRTSGSQSSPRTDITGNTIIDNTQNGIRTYEALGFDINENTIEGNTLSGILCDSNSRPRIFDNYNLSWNKGNGVQTKANSRPRISNNSITYNYASGVFVENGYSGQMFDNLIRDNLGAGIESIGSTPNIHDNQIIFNNHSGVYIQGGGSAPIIKTNELNNNSWCGVETNSSDVQIQDNDIIYNTQDGIKITRGSPSITSNNNVNYNSWNGVAGYSKCAPLIANSEFRFNNKNGIYLDNSDPRVSGINNNLITNNTFHGVVAVNGSGGKVRADIYYNTLDGVYTTGSGTNTEFLNCDIANNLRNGVNASLNSAPTISNSTIANNAAEDFWLDGSADVISLNNSFNRSKVWYGDTASTFTVKWYISILTRAKATGVPEGDVKVWVNSTIQSQVVWTGRTDFNGEVSWLKVTEYVEKDSNSNNRGTDGGERTMWTPHDVSGDKTNFRETHVSPNPTIDRSLTVILDLDPNRAPSLVSGILPRVTHNPRPRITWNPATDPDPGHVVSYYVWIGSNINTSDIYESALVPGTSYVLPTDLDYDSDGNKTYYITIVSNDLHGGQRYTIQPMYLLNSAPIKPQINLTLPAKPSEIMNRVECVITVPGSDPDGDEINYTYKWYKNGNEQILLRESGTKALTDEISIYTDAITFKKGEEWQVRVRTEDGLGRWSDWASELFFIGNLGPESVGIISDITMDEDTELTEVIDLTEAFIDPDQDVSSLKYKISVSDINLTVTKNKDTHKVSFIPAPNWNGKVMVNFTCEDNEGLWVTQFMNVTVTPVNDEPIITMIGGKPITTSILEFTDDDAAVEEHWFNLTVVASDIDIERGEADEIAFKITNESVLLTPDENNPLKATLSFYPTNNDIGNFEFMISIKDKTMRGYKQTIVIKIEVKNENDAPYLVSIKELPNGDTYTIPLSRVLDLTRDISIDEDEKLSLLVIADDPDPDDELQFHTDSSSIVEVDKDTGNPYSSKFIITPTPDVIGEFTFNITVKDRKLERDTVQVIIRIKNVNDKPTVKIISPAEYGQVQVFEPGQKITFEGQAEDIDIPYGDSLTYKWTSDMDGDLGYDIKIPDVDTLTVGEHVITFIAEDSFGETASTHLNIIIGGIDLDSDNIPDNWERLYFDSMNKYDGHSDPDGDGYSNLEEFNAETDPTDIDDPDKQPEEDELDLGMVGAIVAVIIIVIIVLLLLFIMMKKKRKPEEKEEFTIEKPTTPGVGAGRGLELVPSMAGGTGALPERGVEEKDDKGDEAPKELKEVGDDDKGDGPKPPMPMPPGPGMPPGMPPGMMPPGPGMPPGLPPGMVPPQIMNCPKCSTVMTFSPGSGMFCMKCGFKPGK